MEQNIKKFIENEILTWSIIAGLSRGKRVYLKQADNSSKNSFKKFLRNELYSKFNNNYRVNSEAKYLNNLKKFKNNIDTEFQTILERKEIYFGRVQKIINLYLKYRWVCFNEQKPIHCPVDSIVLAETSFKNKIHWTTMMEDQYKKVMEEIKTLAKKQNTSIAKWEIDLFNRNNMTYK